ncbi:MAG TPA: alpha/beta hydrolase, partial [Bradyrhizobium sp.]|nr:alpha/beta hydrolase [Bradyrhizobium sp.]
MKTTRITDKRHALDRRQIFFGLPLLAAGAAGPHEVLAAKASSGGAAPIVTYHRTTTIDGIKIFYREAGPA